MKQIAINACYELAGWIHDGQTFAWAIADRIERRFNIVGVTDYYLRHWQKEREKYLQAECKRHDELNPNRLTYLHR